MAKESLLATAKRYLDYLTDNGIQPIRMDVTRRASECTSGEIQRHLAWMCEHIEKLANQDEMEKANRWLGFVQGILFEMSVYTIEDLRSHNEHREIP